MSETIAAIKRASEAAAKRGERLTSYAIQGGKIRFTYGRLPKPRRESGSGPSAGRRGVQGALL